MAAATDWLDGYLARKLGMVTPLGKLLDPLADKILVCAAFVYFPPNRWWPMPPTRMAATTPGLGYLPDHRPRIPA